MRQFLAVAGLMLVACQAEVGTTAGPATMTVVPPFAEKHWGAERVTFADGRSGCAVRAHALEVIVPQGGTPYVHTLRSSPVGTIFRVTVREHTFRTRERTFSIAETPALLVALRSGGKAYLEWREPGDRGEGVRRFTDIVDLEGFALAYDTCAQ